MHVASIHACSIHTLTIQTRGLCWETRSWVVKAQDITLAGFKDCMVMGQWKSSYACTHVGLYRGHSYKINLFSNRFWRLTYIHTHLHTYIRTYVRTYIHTYIHSYIHTYIHTYIRTYVRTYIHTYIHISIHIRTYIFTLQNGKSVASHVYILERSCNLCMHMCVNAHTE